MHKTNVISEILSFMHKHQLGSLNSSTYIYPYYVDNVLVALLLLDKNNLHPYSYHIRIFVEPNYRRKKIATELIQKVKMQHSEKLRIAFDSQRTDLAQFVAALGFKHYVSCFLPTYAKEDIKPLVLSTYLTFHTLEHLSIEQKINLQELLYKHYKRDHVYNQVNPLISVPEFSDNILKNCDERNSYIIYKDDAMIAYMITYPSSEKELEIGYIGSEKISYELKQTYYAIICQLFTKFSYLSFEVDNVNEMGMSVLELFKALPQNSWDIYLQS